MTQTHIRPARPADVPLILSLVRELAEYERAPAEVEATEQMIRDSLFGAAPACEALIGEIDGAGQGFALFFHNYSTWKGRRGVYLEDLFVSERYRRRGVGAALFEAVSRLAVERGCGRLECAVLDWNRSAIEDRKSTRLNSSHLGISYA